MHYSEAHINREPDLKIQVLRIPANGAAFEIAEVPSIIMTNIDDDVHRTQTLNLENRLGHVPDLRKFDQFIDLKFRCLFDMDYHPHAARNPWAGRFFVYKCLERKSKLPKNKYFPDARAYGDVFVFKLNDFTPWDEEKHALFGNMNEFADSVECGGVGRTMLKKMLVV